MTTTATGRLAPANAQAFQRWYGWIITLAGLALAAVWLVAPIESAKWISVSVLGGGMVLGAAGFVRLTQRR